MSYHFQCLIGMLHNQRSSRYDRYQGYPCCVSAATSPVPLQSTYSVRPMVHWVPSGVIDFGTTVRMILHYM